MSATTDRLADFTKRGQEAFTSALGTWAETLESFTGRVTAADLAALRPSVADATALVDSSFSVAEKVLAGQRDLVKSVVGASAQVVETVGQQAGKATETFTNTIKETVGRSYSAE